MATLWQSADQNTQGQSPAVQLEDFICCSGGATKRRGQVDKKMTLKQYNDAIYSEGSMSIELLRAIITNQPIKRDFKTGWRFYDINKN